MTRSDGPPTRDASREERTVDAPPPVDLDPGADPDPPQVDVDPDRYVAAGDAALSERFDEALSFEEYVERIFENPTSAAHSAKYLLRAIESMGTRTTVERGERRLRYRFFDDPLNDGEHAVLGNTATLTEFVEDLEAIAADRAKSESVIWFTGPTATGKSELKRCLINGLRAFSRTPAGRRYTLEWNPSADTGVRGSLSYGEFAASPAGEWRESPVQAHPLLVLPPEVRAELLADLNDADPSPIDTVVEGELPPFSREIFEGLADEYRDRDGMLSAITAESHLRVKNFVVTEGRGVGVLHAEDSGSPKERLTGSWMSPVLGQLGPRGRKDPQAFSYDGALSQGNGGLTIIEDASEHGDLLQQLLTVPEEGRVKLDRGSQMGVDTQIVVISNPDLEAELNRHAESDQTDPLKALKRRLTKYEFRYLLNVRLESQLLRRKLDDAAAAGNRDPVATEPARAPLELDVAAPRDDAAVVTRELAPHAVEAAATYAVVTRLDADDLPGNLGLVEKARLFDQGYVHRGDAELTAADFEFDPDAADGATGVPVTYIRDVVAELLSEPRDRSHESLPVEDVVLPRDVLDAMVTGLASEPVFSDSEVAAYESRLVEVKEYVLSRQVDDVQAAMTRDEHVSRAAIADYVEAVFAWDGVDEGDASGDALTMKLFETEQLGRFDESDYDDLEPGPAVRTFRRQEVIAAVNSATWHERDEDFSGGGVEYRDVPALRAALETTDWDDVRSSYEDLDPAQWDDPGAGTETARVKAETIENMTELFGYSEASAELVSRLVLSEVSHRWD